MLSITKELLTDKIILLHINRSEGTKPLSDQMHLPVCTFQVSLASKCKEQHFDGTHSRTSVTLTLNRSAENSSNDQAKGQLWKKTLHCSQ